MAETLPCQNGVQCDWLSKRAGTTCSCMFGNCVLAATKTGYVDTVTKRVIRTRRI
ncbi:hypothetical protein [Alicyclobacillus sp. ALC3]|uniref:hypothetical protein n=1 Tax=Alicyclobacillus sp. ALC3 TaxID=2796143 RepID=UPI00237900CE|nr:hypothetical protein [Alicyclobacillus sp. ALC3]WDL97813.1 hypothetical protein JC200_03520 [Alicyclobacillus sp. ALC3]